MKHNSTNKTAIEISKDKGINLTNKRRKIFDIVIKSAKPISAYDIVSEFQETYDEQIPVMSVYRILNFLIDNGLVHKLDSINQYIVCEHLDCEHEHLNTQFLICNDCNSTEEIMIRDELHQQLTNDIDQTGFKLKELKFELHGICANCQPKK